MLLQISVKMALRFVEETREKKTEKINVASVSFIHVLKVVELSNKERFVVWTFSQNLVDCRQKGRRVRLLWLL